MGDDQIALQRICNRVQAEGLRRLRRFDSGQGYAPSGALSARAWLRWQLNLTANAASERVAIARKLASLAQTEQALADGDISYRHVTLIVETATQLGDKFEAQAETILVDVSKEVCPWRLQRAIWNLKHCLDSDGVLGDANKANSRRFLHLSQTFDGVYRIDGWLDAEGGATLHTALDSIMGPWRDGDDRSATQRRADAVVEMARRQLDGGQLPAVAGQKPHLAVSVDMATLSKEPGSMAAELAWSQPIPAETARRLACDAAITPIIDGEADHTSRVVPGATRRALIARARAAGSLAVTARRRGRMRITSNTGPMAVRPPSITSSFCVAGITGWFTKRAGRSSWRTIETWSRFRLNTLGCHRNFVALTSLRARHRRLLRARRPRSSSRRGPG
jgi:hypothetical protein